MSSLFSQPASPATIVSDATAYTLGIQFRVSSNASMTGIWFYSASGASSLPTTIALYNQTTGSLITSQSPTWLNHPGGSSASAGSGWCYAAWSSAQSLTANTQYEACVFRNASGNWYAATANYWSSGAGSSGISNGIISAPNNASAVHGQDSYHQATSLGQPTSTVNSTNYWIDVEIATGTSAPAGVASAAAAAAAPKTGHGAKPGIPSSSASAPAARPLLRAGPSAASVAAAAASGTPAASTAAGIAGATASAVSATVSTAVHTDASAQPANAVSAAVSAVPAAAPAPPAAAVSAAVSAATAIGARENYCEPTGSIGNTVTAANTTGPTQFSSVSIGAGCSLVFDNTVVHRASSVFKMVTVTGGSLSVRAVWSIGNGGAAQYLSGYVYLPAYPAFSSGQPRLCSFTNGPGARFKTSGTGQIGIYNTGGTLIASLGSDLPTGKWIRFEYEVKNVSGTTGDCALRVYYDANLESSTPSDSCSVTGSANLVAGGWTSGCTANCGNSTNVTFTSNWTIYYDDWALSTTGQLPARPGAVGASADAAAAAAVTSAPGAGIAGTGTAAAATSSATSSATAASAAAAQAPAVSAAVSDAAVSSQADVLPGPASAAAAAPPPVPGAAGTAAPADTAAAAAPGMAGASAPAGAAPVSAAAADAAVSVSSQTAAHPSAAPASAVALTAAASITLPSATGGAAATAASAEAGAGVQAGAGV